MNYRYKLRVLSHPNYLISSQLVMTASVTELENILQVNEISVKYTETGQGKPHFFPYLIKLHLTYRKTVMGFFLDSLWGFFLDSLWLWGFFKQSMVFGFFFRCSMVFRTTDEFPFLSQTHSTTNSNVVFRRKNAVIPLSEE